jgi:hypothetical protein
LLVQQPTTYSSETPVTSIEKRSLAYNINELLDSLEAIALDVTNEGTVHRSSLKVPLNPYDLVPEFTPDEIRKMGRREKLDLIL